MSKRLIYAEDAIDALKSLEFRQYMDFGEYIGEDIREVCLIRAEKARDALQSLPSAQPQLEDCPIYGGMCGYPSNLCYECPRHGGAHEKPLWWKVGQQTSAQPEPLKIHLDPELTKEEWERLMRIGDSPVMVIPPDRQEITVESAVGFLQSIGWMQEHDELMYKQGYKHGKSKGIKRGLAMARRKEAGGD